MFLWGFPSTGRRILLKAWLDGDISEQTSVLTTNSLHYGRAAFEGIRAYRKPAGGSVIFKAEEHFERLNTSCSAAFLPNQMSTPEWIEACNQLLTQVNLRDAYLRPIVFEGNGLGNLANEYPVHHAILVWEWNSSDENEFAVNLAVSPFRRSNPMYSPCFSKLSGNYLLAKTAVKWALQRGADDAIIRTHEGNVSEASARNLFAVYGGVLVTPTQGECLNGITRQTMIQLARDLGVKVEERSLECSRLLEADEVFLTSTASELVRVASIDLEGHVKQFTEGEIAKELSKAYTKLTRGDA